MGDTIIAQAVLFCTSNNVASKTFPGHSECIMALFFKLDNLKMYGLQVPEFPNQHATWGILGVKVHAFQIEEHFIITIIQVGGE